MSEEPPEKKGKTDPYGVIEGDYFAVFYICEEPILTVTFIPFAELHIDFTGDVWAQTRDQMDILYKSCTTEEEYETKYKGIDTVQEPHRVAHMFATYRCIAITYGFE